MSTCRVATIGVYGFSGETFLAALKKHAVSRVLDVRQRRGVRGTEYAWANSLRLQRALAGAGIGYEHRKELAPTLALRKAQYREDARLGVGKRNRVELSEEYRRGYLAEVLDAVDLSALLPTLDEGLAALLCVERDPEACHRSLIADRLTAELGCEVLHIRPS